jgi:hypothetical protein
VSDYNVIVENDTDLILQAVDNTQIVQVQIAGGAQFNLTAQLPGIQGAKGDSWQEEFETVSKNLKSYPAVLSYISGSLTTIVYDLGGGQSITKTFGYSLGKLVTITLSGDTPSGIDLIKTFSYTGDDLTGVTYT